MTDGLEDTGCMVLQGTKWGQFLCIYLWHQLRRDIISQPASAVAVPSLPRAMMGHHTLMPAHNSTKIYSASDVTQRNMELKSYLYILESNV